MTFTGEIVNSTHRVYGVVANELLDKGGTM